MRTQLLWFLAATSAGCAIENDLYNERAVDVFEQAPNDEVDILFVVDDSISMEDEQRALADGFDAFLDEIVDSETDYRIGLTSTSQDSGDPRFGRLIGDPPWLGPADDTLALFPERVRLGTEGSDKEKGLTAAYETLHRNRDFLRNGAGLVVVFASDENDCSDDGALDGQTALSCYTRPGSLVPVHEMVERVQRLKQWDEPVRFGGILAPLDGSCPNAYHSERYVEAVLRTGGHMGKICDTDWTPVLAELGTISTGMVHEFQLSQHAADDTIDVEVDGDAVLEDPTQGWTYDGERQMIVFHGAAVPPWGAVIEVAYEVAPRTP